MLAIKKSCDCLNLFGLIIYCIKPAKNSVKAIEWFGTGFYNRLNARFFVRRPKWLI